MSRSAALALAATTIVVDQLTKAWFERGACGDLICPLRNDELMLGVVGGPTPQVIAASVLSLALFWVWVKAASRRARVPTWVIALVVAGVIGNLLDRVVLGSVRDFLAFPGGILVNVADLALVAGLLIAVGFVGRDLAVGARHVGE